MNPCYLGKHASQIKSYCWSLSGSHCRSFWIRPEKLPEAPPDGEITMTSYMTCNKTLLSRKTCIPDKKVTMKHNQEVMALFQNGHEKSPEAPPSVEIKMTSYSACNKTSLSWKPCIAFKKLVWIIIGRRKSQNRYISPPCGGAHSQPICTKFGAFVDLTDVIKPVKFGSQQFICFSRLRGQKTHFPSRKQTAHITEICATALDFDIELDQSEEFWLWLKTILRS